MASTSVLKVKIIGDASDANAALDGVDRKTGKWSKGLKVAGGVAVAAGATVKVAYDQMIKPAGDLEQSIGAIDTVFKGNAKQVHKWAKGAATDVGLTRNEYNELGTLIGTQLKNGGTAMDQLGPKTNKLIGLGADLSSMFGGTSKEAVEALSSALKGERDPIEKYGVSLKQSAIDAEAARLGHQKVGGSFSDQAQQAATLSLIYKQTSDAQGNFAKESETLQGKQQRLTAQFENAKATLGTALLPIATKFFGFLADTALPAITRLIDGFSNFGAAGDSMGDLSTKLGLDKLGPMFTNIGTLWQTFVSTYIPMLVTAFKTIGPPLLEAGQAIVGLVSAIAQRLVPVIKFLAPYIAQTFRGMAEIIAPVLRFIAATIRTVTAIIKGDWSGAWNGIKAMFSAVWDFIKALVRNALRALQTILSTAWKAIKVVASAAWNGIKALIGKAWDGIKAAVTRRVNLIKSGLSAAWKAIKSTASNAWNGIKNLIGKAWDGIKAAVTRRVNLIKSGLSTAWNLIKSTASNAWNGIKNIISKAVDGLKNAVKTRVDAVRRLFSDLPKKIKSGLGNVGSMLTDIGKKIINGLIRGIKSKFGEVKSSLNGLTKNIPKWKGPHSTDKKLLEPAGTAIMGGLIRSIDRERGHLRATLKDVTKDITRTSIPAPALGTVAGTRSSSTRSSSTRAAGGTVININVTGALDPLSTARQIEDILARRRIIMGGAA